jgi:hypothetical protein
MKYILNSAVITAPGIYEYRLITLEEAREWYGSGEGVFSTIGYPETAEALSLLLGKPIKAIRITIEMGPGDSALVFRPKLPPGSQRIDPKDKGSIMQHIMARHWELGLLLRRE